MKKNRENAPMIKRICVMLLLCLCCSSSKEPSVSIKDNGTVSINEGRFVFSVPQGWAQMSEEQCMKMKPFITGFHADTSFDPTPSCFLVEISTMKVSKKQKSKIIDNAQKLSRIIDLKKQIENKDYDKNPEFYNAYYDVFIIVKAYPDGLLTVAMKKFDNQGAILFHYYLLGELAKDIDAIDQILKSLKKRV